MAARDYDEDRFYTDEWLTSPQKTRAYWGEPEPWMKWGGGGAMNGSGDWDYSGFHRQDKTMPFVVYGGGFDIYQKYVGPYTMICENGFAPIINDDLNWNGTTEPFLKYFSFRGGGIRLIRKSDGYEYKCSFYPARWLDLETRSPFFKEFPSYNGKEERFEQEWGLIAQAKRMMMIDTMGYGDKYIAKWEEITDEYLTILLAVIGDEHEMFETPQYFSMRFDFPDEVKPFRHLLSEADMSSLTSYPETSTGLYADSKNIRDNNYLIFKNGLYLRLYENRYLGQRPL